MHHKRALQPFEMYTGHLHYTNQAYISQFCQNAKRSLFEYRTLSTFPSSLSAFPSAVTSRSSPPGMMLVCGGRVCPSGGGQYILRQSPEQSCYTRSSRDYPAPLLGATKTASRAERPQTPVSAAMLHLRAFQLMLTHKICSITF